MAAGRGTRLRPRRPTHCTAPTATRLGLRLRRGCGRGRGRGWGRGADASTHRRGVGHDAVRAQLRCGRRWSPSRAARRTSAAPPHAAWRRLDLPRGREARRTGAMCVFWVSLCWLRRVIVSRWHFHIDTSLAPPRVAVGVARRRPWHTRRVFVPHGSMTPTRPESVVLVVC